MIALAWPFVALVVAVLLFIAHERRTAQRVVSFSQELRELRDSVTRAQADRDTQAKRLLTLEQEVQHPTSGLIEKVRLLQNTQRFK